MDEHQIDIPTPCGIEGLARPLSDELKIHSGRTLIDTLELREQTSILKASRGCYPEHARPGGGCSRCGARRLILLRRSIRASRKSGEDEKDQNRADR